MKCETDLKDIIEEATELLGFYQWLCKKQEETMEQKMMEQESKSQKSILKKIENTASSVLGISGVTSTRSIARPST